ncbi:hypothetical protein [Janthinobacterium sp. 1_2014MBL_MicDiv]|uniref:hypothetical protein n=1 Tax=Janthinobacterium sp. 1_2014MBL_MicDiv TaxID=1644131 RepID=UPI000AE06DF8|nr:hypothetical protein [Janthinobacterium sp. 1_2014MBL_MicDiv]
MNKVIKRICVLALLALSSAAYAWTPAGEPVSIKEVIVWQDASPIVVKLSNGLYCHVMPEEKNLYALVLTLYASGKTASIYCYDTVEDKSGYSSRRLHRIGGLS